MRITYDWKRFWCPREGKISLDDAGFLADPEGPLGHVLNSELRTFENLPAVPCLVLLGEPGIGKSMTLAGHRESLKSEIRDESSELLWVDLKMIGSEEVLLREVFGSPQVTAWKNGKSHLHLYLDAVDECSIRIQVFKARLLYELDGSPLERLSIRLVCRTAAWPETLEQGLLKLFREGGVSVFHLAPLRRSEVETAATAEGLDATSFVQEVLRADATALAVRPVTLRFLLDRFRRGNRLAVSRSALYLDGCRELCEESDHRRESGPHGQLTADQRLAVASRVAAATLLAGRGAVFIGREAEAEDTDVTLRVLAGGIERVAELELAVGESAIKEVLDTGLFSWRGAQRFGLSHQTYGEFLAARYLVESGIGADAIVRLLWNPEDPDRRIVPRLSDIAAWAASLDGAVYRRVLTTNPEILLRSDPREAQPGFQAELVEHLLRGYDERQILPLPFGADAGYRRLRHSGLEAQLRAILRDPSRSEFLRDIVLDIAMACDLATLGPDAVAVALDSKEPLRLRVTAAALAYRLGDSESRRGLKPLISLPRDQDPDEDLRGWALRACWPRELTVPELLAALTPPREPSYFGSYWVFLQSDPLASLSDADLPSAIEWARAVVTTSGSSRFDELVNYVVLRSLAHLFRHEIVDGLADILMTRSRLHESVAGQKDRQAFSEALAANEDGRRELIRSLLARSRPGSLDVVAVATSIPGLRASSDLPWAVDTLRGMTPGPARTVWLEYLRYVADPDNPVHVVLLKESVGDIPELPDNLPYIFRRLEAPDAPKLSAPLRPEPIRAEPPEGPSPTGMPAAGGCAPGRPERGRARRAR